VPPQCVSPCTTEAQRGCTAADWHYNPAAPPVPLLTLALLARHSWAECSGTGLRRRDSAAP
jgi:hypothetical protein